MHPGQSKERAGNAPAVPQGAHYGKGLIRSSAGGLIVAELSGDIGEDEQGIADLPGCPQTFKDSQAFLDQWARFEDLTGKIDRRSEIQARGRTIPWIVERTAD